MRIFISGGCKNGKSTYAQWMAKQQMKHLGSLYYVATMTATDNEDIERIERHQKERDGWGFTTIEQPLGIEGILHQCDCSGSFLLDSLTALLANEMFSVSGAFDDSDISSGFDFDAHKKIAAGITQILSKVGNIVIVSDYLYSDAAQYDQLTEAYRKSLAALDRLTANHCDIVLEAAYTQIIVHKGRILFEKLFGKAPYEMQLKTPMRRMSEEVD